MKVPENFQIILVRPETPENIGLVARAEKYGIFPPPADGLENNPPGEPQDSRPCG